MTGRAWPRNLSPVLRRTTTIASLAPVLLAALACGGGPAPVAPAVSHALEFIADDWPRGLAEAKGRRVPIFVEAWAPW